MITVNKMSFRKIIALMLAFAVVVSLVAFTSGCDNGQAEENTTTTASAETTTDSAEPTKKPVQDEVSEAGKAYFNELLGFGKYACCPRKSKGNLACNPVV